MARSSNALEVKEIEIVLNQSKQFSSMRPLERIHHVTEIFKCGARTFDPNPARCVITACLGFLPLHLIP